MPRQAAGRVTAKFEVNEYETAIGAGGSTSVLAHLLEIGVDLANGTSDGQIDRVYSDSISVTTGTDLDLVGSTVLSKLNGQAISLVDLVALVVVNTDPTADIVVGGDANSIPIFGAAAHTCVIPPGGAFLWYGGPAGKALVAGTGDILQLAASAGTATCRVAFAGRSA